MIFSGIQPTGPLHLGNYFGAIKLWEQLQDDLKNQCIYSIVDLHSISLRHDPVLLKVNTKIMIASLLACGIDPDKSTLFLQSTMPQHTYLNWILYTLIGEGRLLNQPQYKVRVISGFAMKSIILISIFSFS